MASGMSALVPMYSPNNIYAFRTIGIVHGGIFLVLCLVRILLALNAQAAVCVCVCANLSKFIASYHSVQLGLYCVETSMHMSNC